MLSEKLLKSALSNNCDNCENYQKKEAKETFEDSFTINGKKGETCEVKEVKILWYDVYENYYEICFRTKNKIKNTIEFDRTFWKNISVNIIR